MFSVMPTNDSGNITGDSVIDGALASTGVVGVDGCEPDVVARLVTDDRGATVALLPFARMNFL